MTPLNIPWCVVATLRYNDIQQKSGIFAEPLDDGCEPFQHKKKSWFFLYKSYQIPRKAGTEFSKTLFLSPLKLPSCLSYFVRNELLLTSYGKSRAWKRSRWTISHVRTSVRCLLVRYSRSCVDCSLALLYFTRPTVGLRTIGGDREKVTIS